MHSAAPSERLPLWLLGDIAAGALALALACFILFDLPFWGMGAFGVFALLAGAFLYLSKGRGMTLERKRAKPVPDLYLEPEPSPWEEAGGSIVAAREREVALGVDPTTGLARWWVFRERAISEMARAERHGHALSILVLEPANLLAEPAVQHRAHAARALHHALRSMDFAAQCDEERFAVMLPETDGSGARSAGRRLIETLRSAGDATLRWRASLVTYPDHGATPDALMWEARRTLQPGRLESALRQM
jgi:GGDEF domain-containing protein